MTTAASPFDRALAIADAVLLEGYVLYPYRASAPKNQFRWTFGVLAPRAWSEAGGCEAWWLESRCLVEPRAGAPLRVDGRLRFLQVEQRRVERASEGGAFEPVEALEVAGRKWVTFEEGRVREFDFALEPPAAGASSDGSSAAFGRALTFEAEAGSVVELIREGLDGGAVVGRVVRERHAVMIRVAISFEPVPAAERPLMRLCARVENATPWAAAHASRDEALRAASIATHLLFRVSGGGAFVSLTDPPGWAAHAAAETKNVRSWPVLAGEEGRDDLVLAAPIILYDHPRLAPESPGDFFDATEIDELLTLRTATLTPEEKREARATDPRAAAIIDRVERLPREVMGRLHGALREPGAVEMVPRADARPAAEKRWSASAAVAPGARVRLRPGKRRTDAQDLLYAGMVATVREVRPDVDGRVFLGVTIDGDPAAELHDWCGRYHYYEIDEVELIAEEAGAPCRSEETVL